MKYPSALALVAAQRIVEKFRPACELIEIAGSLRRGRPLVGDIEIVATPLMEDIPGQRTLWGTATTQVPETERVFRQLLNEKLVSSAIENPRNGLRYKRFLDVGSGIPVDLFLVLPPAQWGPILLLRTGPDKANIRLMQIARERGFLFEDGQVLDRNSRSGREVIDTPDEAAVYAAIGLEYIGPERRDEWGA